MGNINTFGICPYSSYKTSEGLGLPCLNCEITSYDNCWLVKLRGDNTIIEEHKLLKLSIEKDLEIERDPLKGRKNI